MEAILNLLTLRFTWLGLRAACTRAMGKILLLSDLAHDGSLIIQQVKLERCKKNQDES